MAGSGTWLVLLAVLVVAQSFATLPPAEAHGVPAAAKPSILAALVRDGEGEGLVELQGIYAVPEYWHIQEIDPAKYELQPEKYETFLIMLNVHVGELPHPDWSKISTLTIDGTREYQPLPASGLIIDSPHHQTIALLFPKTDPVGNPTITRDTKKLEVVIKDLEGLFLQGEEVKDDVKTIRWSLPVAIPEGAPQVNSIFALAVVIPVFAGFFFYLSPCFLELTSVYVAMISGVRIKELREKKSNKVVRTKVLLSAMLFVGGFALIYTLAGAVAGFGGALLQGSLFQSISFPLRLGGGTFMVFLGLQSSGVTQRMGFTRRILGLRTSPIFPRVANSCRTGGSFLVGLSFGCLQCFRGSIVAAMLFYAWALGSATQGAFMLLLLSLSFGIPFIAVAAVAGRSTFFERLAPRLVGVTSVATGVLLVVLGFATIVFDEHPLFDLINTFFHIGPV